MVIPSRLRRDMRQKLNASHLGVESCLQGETETIFWLGISNEITEIVAMCETCQKYETSSQKEPLMPHKVLSRPCEQVGQDLPALSEGDVVQIKSFQLAHRVWKMGTVTSRLEKRSYMVELPDGATYRRNQLHLKKTKETLDPPTAADIPFTESLKAKHTQTLHKQVPSAPPRQPHPSQVQDHSASDDLQQVTELKTNVMGPLSESSMQAYYFYYYKRGY